MSRVLLLWIASAAAGCAASMPAALEFTLQTRDAASGRALTTREKIDPQRTGIVIIDMWNYHWCMTAAQRVGALAPRMNQALAAARKLGMQVMWAPTDVAAQYAGTPQRERSIAVPYFPAPALKDFVCRLTAKQGKCLCGPGLHCVVNYGWDGMNPGLRIDRRDLIVSGLDELYGNCRALRLERLIYMGVHTNVCVVGKPEAIRNMVGAGMQCVLARDLTDAITRYDPESGYTPDDGTAQTVADIEKAGVPTIDMAAEMRSARAWDDSAVVELVRISPWGSADRPYTFTDSVTVTLTSPWLAGDEIRYTVDRSEPGPDSLPYLRPIRMAETTLLRAAAFRQRRRVSLPGESLFVRLPAVPPNPDVYLDGLNRLLPSRLEWTWEPKVDESYHGGPLRIRSRTYAKGMGMRAPSHLLYEVRPEYDRFVALAGVDDGLFRQRHHAQYMAMHASVQFRVYIDGSVAAESPVMRISQEPWRFDVKIPPGSRRINLVIADAGSPSPHDIADWVDAGFVIRK